MSGSDIAELGFKVDNKPLADLNTNLEKIPPRAEKAEQATDKFNREVSKTPGAVQKAAGGMNTMLTAVMRLAAGVAAYLSIDGLISYADAWSDMQSRVGAAIKDMDAAPAMMQRLVEIANASYSPLAQTAEIYGRNVSVLKALGLGAAQAADYTESLNHMLVITATRGERAESVQNALSKAMALGKLTGEGLETVLANGGRVAEALAAELGTTVNGLRAMASEGKITSSVIANALTKSLEEVREEAGAMTATVADAFVIMNNNITAAIGQFDKAHGVSATLAEGIIWLANNFDTAAIAVASLAAGVTTYMLPSLIALTPAILSATLATTRFTIALLANPLTWYAAIVAVAVAGLMQYISTQNLAAQAAQTHAENLVTNANAIEVAKTSSQGFRDTLRGQIEMQLNAAKAALDEAGAQYQAAKATAIRADAFGGLMNTLAKSMGMPGRDVDYGNEIMQGALDNINTAIGRIDELKTQLGSLDKVEATYAPTIHSLTAVGDAAAGAKAKIAQVPEAIQAAFDAAKEQWDFYKNTFGSFMSDFRRDLMSGTSLWDSFANAASKALDSIADRAMSMAANGIFDMLFGAVMGNSAGAGWGVMGGFAGKPGMFGLPGFSSGGYTGNGSVTAAAGITHGQEFVMNAAATQAIGVQNLQSMNDNHVMPAASGGNAGFVYNDNRVYDFSGSAMNRDEVEEILARDREEIFSALPDAIRDYQNDPRKRTVKAA